MKFNAYIYTMEYYTAIKKNTFESVLMRWMKLEQIIQSEVSQKVSFLIMLHLECKQKLRTSKHHLAFDILILSSHVLDLVDTT